MFRREPLLPDGRLYGLLWGIPEEFGGMTRVALQRASSFAEVDGRVVEILTLTPRMTPRRRRAALRASKSISRRVRIRNLWADLRRMSNRQLRELQGTAKAPFDAVELNSIAGTDESTRKDGKGNALQVDRYRKDGTLLAVDRLDVRQRGQRGGRQITVFGRNGVPVAQWQSEAAFYHSWIDWVIRDSTATIISDSSPIGGMMHSYRRDNVTVVQVLHNPHLKDPAGSPYGLLPPAKKAILSNLDRYDLVATLTDDQRKDMLASSMAVDKITTVSNVYHGPVVKRIEPRPPERGVMLGRLVRQKRVDHAIRAMASVRRSFPEATLDVYGNGSLEAQLTRLIEELGVESVVRLKGFHADARAKLQNASFSVLSSRYEGQSLVLLESLAAGCIPIAYDVPYGVSDIITDGVDGFLVPAGDTEALAGAIQRVVSLSPHDLAVMRQAAVRRVADFAPEIVTRRWGEVLREAAATKTSNRHIHGRATLLDAHAVNQGVHLDVEVALDSSVSLDRALITWVGRKTAAFGREPAIVEGEGKTYHASAVVPDEKVTALGRGLLDVFIDYWVEGTPHRTRIAAPGLERPVGDGQSEFYSTKYGNLSARLHAESV